MDVVIFLVTCIRIRLRKFPLACGVRLGLQVFNGEGQWENVVSTIKQSCTVKDLLPGSRNMYRVVAENIESKNNLWFVLQHSVFHE